MLYKFGENMKELIKYIRSSLGISQQELASDLRTAFATVNRWENGKSTPTNSMQKLIYDYCLEKNVDLSKFIISYYKEQQSYFINSYNSKDIYFHGSKAGIENEIRPISRSLCDFGKGFYLGSEVMQPLTLICNYPNPKLYIVSIDKKDLNTLYLDSDIFWAFFIAYNRGKLEKYKDKKIYKKCEEVSKDIDLIVGDIADDKMFYVLDSFFEGTISDEGLIECLTTLNLGKQYVAKTINACKKINILKEYNLSELELLVLKNVSEKNREIGINQANEICKNHRRTGRFFDEILEEDL